MRNESLTPKEFLRARRPERFSDSTAQNVPALDRSILEYHLDTLTSRSQESQFANFARRLVEREICPNLLPQTGPTGGGDSKVDSETYPVADNISVGWYLGIGREAASERWAFAFSAKKAWREKVRSDVAKIVSTERGYSKAFFVSNQFVPDRLRAEVEDELRAKCSLDVRILDRTWILDRVFESGHDDLAIEELGLKTAIRKELRKGPLDIQRERELEEVEQRIQSSLQEGKNSLQLVDDCVSAATLARELERPRTEVEGLFLRAQRIAEKYGATHQRLVIAYERALTSFWWFEDYGQFVSLYREVEEMADGSHNVYELELITTLWFLLRSRSNDAEPIKDFETLTDKLATNLNRLSKELERPSTSLQAKTLLLQMQLASHPQGEVAPILKNLQSVILEAEGLVGYPLEPLVNIIMELGAFLEDYPSYGELFDTIVEVASKRKGEIAAARMLLDRGARQLELDRPYEAIRSLGRALTRLYKHESRADLVRALYLCGIAYEAVGLLWAARGAMLSAASVSMNDFWSYADIKIEQLACLDRLKWIELQLGRLPQILAWYEVDRAFRYMLASQGHDTTSLSEGATEFDLSLGALFLRAQISQLEELAALPDVLEKLGLPYSSVALRFALGQDHLPDDFREAINQEHQYAYFARWREHYTVDQPGTDSAVELSATSKMTACALGCRIEVECLEESPCVEVGESVLAALQSLLATSVLGGVVAREPVLSVYPVVAKTPARTGGVRQPSLAFSGNATVLLRRLGWCS